MASPIERPPSLGSARRMLRDGDLVADGERDPRAAAEDADRTNAGHEVRLLVRVQVHLRVDLPGLARLEEHQADPRSGVAGGRRSHRDRDLSHIGDRLEAVEPRVVLVDRQRPRLRRLVAGQRELGEHDHLRAGRGGPLDHSLVALAVAANVAGDRARLHESDSHPALIPVASRSHPALDDQRRPAPDWRALRPHRARRPR